MSYGFTLNNKQYNSWCYLNFQCHMQEGDYTPLTVPDCLYIIFWQFIKLVEMHVPQTCV